MYTKFKYNKKIISYSYTSMYTKYNYMYKKTIKKIISYSYTSMYTKYNYIYMSTIEILYSYMNVYTNLPIYISLPVL